MIGTFWNLCRACPSMPVDKLHSEYRSTYRWHEYTGPRQEIIRRPPQSTPQGAAPAASSRAPDEDAQKEGAGEQTAGSGGFEPALPRRKKNPALAYKTHEFLAMSDVVGSNDSLDTSLVVDRARSEERSGPRERGFSRRSKSEGPPGEYQPEYRTRTRTRYLSPRARPRATNLRCDSDPNDLGQEEVMIATVQQPSHHGGALKNAISRISTEYRLQFAWPKGGGSKEREGEAAAGAGPPRKSLSMGAIRPTGSIMPLNTAIAAVHKKRITDADRKYGAELEPLVGWNTDSQDDGCTQDEGGEEKIQEESLSKEDKSQPRLSRAEFHSEYKKKFRPFSQYDYVEGKFKAKKEPEPLLVHELAHGDSWYREVLELRKKAGEYKHRGWGTELVPQHIAELYNKQMTLWEQVSRRSSLSALSLASTTPRSITKEEKEKENNKKSSPTKPPWSRQSPVRHISQQKKVEKTDDNKKESTRSRKETAIRHHLERTTGAGRSQSVGPNTTYSSENRSPKRSMKPSKPQANGPVPAEKRTRPTTLATGAPSRKSNSGTGTGTGQRRAGKGSTVSEAAMLPKEDAVGAGGGEADAEVETVDGEEPKELTVPEPEPEPIVDVEPVVKSPPEPTRVKSPEQILMRSPEPVNWTVPLDTGKTFTVTQNVHEGDLITRPHSEAKAWTPPAAPPAAPQSAPPQLTETEGWKSPELHPEDILNGKTDTDSLEGKRPNDSGECEGEGENSGRSLSPTLTSTLTSPPSSASASASATASATDVMDVARSRFEKFWGGKQEPLEKEGMV